MSAQSDPDRLARLAKYVVDDPSNTTPAELREALMDAAERIRSLQARDRASRKLVADLLALLDNALAGSCPHVHREQLMMEMRRQLIEAAT